jgi:hypothetical protein
MMYEKDELLARSYDSGIPLEVCQAAYDTVRKEKYTACVFVTSDVNFLDWMMLAGVVIQPKSKLDFVFVTSEADDLFLHVPHVRKRGQVVFYGVSPSPVRAYFNSPSRYEKWLTVELPLGEGLFVARRI